MTNTDETTEYKIILIGNSAVGKTCLFKKITTGNFANKNISTIGMDKRRLSFQITKENKIKNIDISLLDTAGQERFRSITKTYFKGADGIILMYDITNKDSFVQVEEWIKSIHESIGDHNNSNYIIILLGNKKDLVDENKKPRLVLEEEAKEKCKVKNIFWGGECSVKNDTEEDLKNKFQGFVEKIYNKVGDKFVREQKVIKANEKRRRRSFCFW